MKNTRDVLRPFLVMLGSMILVPAVRPALSAAGGTESAMHAFMSLNMLGAIVGAPLLCLWADRRGTHTGAALGLALADAALVAALTLDLPVPALLAIRTVQGAANVGLLSLTMAARSQDAASGSGTHRGLGAVGAAITAAIALGPAVGGALLGFGAHAPFLAAALLDLVVASLLLGASPRVPRAHHRLGWRALRAKPLMVVPLAMAFTERFTVGCLVVSFAVYAHDVLGLTDRQTSLRLSLFVVPFALAMVPMWRFARQGVRARLLGVGATCYGACFVLLAFARGAALDLSLIACGMASAALFAPSLCYAGALLPPQERATGMALFNAAGCLGMTVGPAFAGILSATMRARGLGAEVRHPVVFVLAGCVQLVVVWLLRHRLRSLQLADEVADGKEVAA